MDGDIAHDAERCASGDLTRFVRPNVRLKRDSTQTKRYSTVTHTYDCRRRSSTREWVLYQDVKVNVQLKKDFHVWVSACRALSSLAKSEDCRLGGRRAVARWP